MNAIIQSERLDLITLPLEFIRAALDGDHGRAESLVQFTVPREWPVGAEPDWPDGRHMLTLRLAQLEEDPAVEPWLVRAMVPRGSGVMAGYIGFHAPPGHESLEAISPGAVEFGYTVFPSHRRQGYAREASGTLMKWAHQQHGVTRFVLCVSPDNTPSQSLAASLGFVRIGSHDDEIDGVEDILECVLPDDAS